MFLIKFIWNNPPKKWVICLLNERCLKKKKKKVPKTLWIQGPFCNISEWKYQSDSSMSTYSKSQDGCAKKRGSLCRLASQQQTVKNFLQHHRPHLTSGRCNRWQPSDNTGVRPAFAPTPIIAWLARPSIRSLAAAQSLKVTKKKNPTQLHRTLAADDTLTANTLAKLFSRVKAFDTLATY